MIDENRATPNRIPVRFVDDADAAGGADDLTPEELGRASAYEGETEMQRRIDRGGETDAEGSRGRADDADTAGSLPDSELEENREDQDTVNRSRRDKQQPQTGADERSDARPGGGESRKARPSLSSEAELLAAQAEVSILEDEVARLKGERQELVDQMSRRQADFDNYRKRLERERAETYGRVAADVASELLPVVDNLRRALEAEASSSAGESEEFRNFLRGVELIARQLNGVLEQLGVQEVEAVGRPFDPHFHEAVATEHSDEHEPDTVTQEIQRGYRIGERLLRPAMVKVATR
ncbi:MAG TPA: nucleotide exchange factor GrpE [Pyrinomonadaceae bacterium]